MEDTGIDSKLQSELSEISNSDKCDHTVSHRSTTTTTTFNRNHHHHHHGPATTPNTTTTTTSFTAANDNVATTTVLMTMATGRAMARATTATETGRATMGRR